MIEDLGTEGVSETTSIAPQNNLKLKFLKSLKTMLLFLA
jgi:hypothetical protein